MSIISPTYLWATLVPVGVVSFVYVVRKIREYQWGWVRNVYSLDGRVFIITGANTGLGFEAAKALVARNATVIMGCRSLERAEAAIARIRQKTANGQLVTDCYKKIFFKHKTWYNFDFRVVQGSHSTGSGLVRIGPSVRRQDQDTVSQVQLSN